MKFLIIGDLHGNVPEVHYRDFDAIIAPGDFCSDAPRKYMFEALKRNMDKPGLEMGWEDIIGKRKAREMIKKSLLDGRRILEMLNSYGVPVYIVPGNWDWTPKRGDEWSYMRIDHYKKLIEGLENIVDVHHRKRVGGDYEFIGHGISPGPEYPQNKKDLERLTKKNLAKRKRKYEDQLRKVSRLFDKAKRPVIYLSHNVPYNTRLDRIDNPTSPRNGEHFGSVISRQIIEKYQPLVCIGGHMHENFGKDKIGKTICINSGFGSKVNVLLEVDGNKVKKLEFFDGKKS